MAGAGARHTASSPRIGLALSGGGARGFAHIAVLEALDEFGIRPSIVAGTSMGAIIGAAYAAGMSGADINGYARAVFRNRADVLSRLWQLRPRRIGEIFGRRGLTFAQFDAERVFRAFLPDALPETFADLSLPLSVVATDYYAWREVAISEGPLLRALAASAAMPVLFRPVTIGDRLMLDGGIVNPLPFDLAGDAADIVIAVDVIGGPMEGRGKPGARETLFSVTQLVMQAIMREKMRNTRPPDILLRPPPSRTSVLDFLKVAAIIDAAEGLKDEFKHRLDEVISAAVR